MRDPARTRLRPGWLLGRARRIGTLRVRLTIAVAILSAAGLTAGSALLVHAVETTVVRAIEDQSRSELHVIGGQIAQGVPLSEVRPLAPWRILRFVRPDGTRVDARWQDPGDPSLPPPDPPELAQLLLQAPPPPEHLPPPEVVGPSCSAAPDPAATPGQEGPRFFFVSPAGAPPPDIAGPAPVGAGAGPVRSAGRGGVPGWAASTARVGDWSVVQMPLLSPNDGPVDAVAVSPLADVVRSTATLQRVLAIGVPALVALLTLAAWLLIGRALRPVRVMTQCAAGIADATARDRLAVPPTSDEIGELARTLNGMLDRLADAARRQREFVSDASHELRSPIAATRTQIEVALAHPGRAEPEAVMRGVLAEVTRLEDLVADLLALARLDERRPAPDEEIDLDDVVLEDAARTRAVPVDTRSVTAVKVRGERKSLAHLVRNLLDNAARHAATRVEVSTALDDGVPILVVDDDGPGIPEADRARVFERFTRLSSSRSRDGGGAGLGLALVRRVVEQHGGAVRVDRSLRGGARLEVRFPRAASG
jgi:signal transduction histidine kinase